MVDVTIVDGCLCDLYTPGTIDADGNPQGGGFLWNHHTQTQIDSDNLIALDRCKEERENRIDIASGLLALATFLIYDRYNNKYGEVLEWRDVISNKIKDCLKQDIDHYMNVVMSHMCNMIDRMLAFEKITVDYKGTMEKYCGFGDKAALQAQKLIDDHNNCPGCAECMSCGNDLQGWAMMNAISAADDRVRFDEARIPRRLDNISSGLNSVHDSTFKLPSFDYQAWGNAANIASSLASAYSGIANSALGSFGYFSANFINSLGNN